MHTKQLLMAALLAAAFAPAMARADAGFDEDSGAPHVVRERFVFNGAEDELNLAGHDVLSAPLMTAQRKVVKNAPYSAEVVSEQLQTLNDGNQISNKTSSMSYRDSAGRTRQEVRNAAGVVRHITISDPVEGTTYLLNPEAKTATKIGPQREIARLAGDKARARIAEMHKEGDGAREEIIIKRIERGDGEAGQKIRENVRIQVSRALAGQPMPNLERLGPMISGAFGDVKWSSKASTKDLGSKEIDGVKAQGKLRSYEIPAGEIGNRNPIVVSTETWYAPELQVTLLSKRSDPRVGERSYRLAGLKRDEPAAALFSVPADYTVKDVMAGVRKRLEEHK